MGGPKIGKCRTAVGFRWICGSDLAKPQRTQFSWSRMKRFCIGRTLTLLLPILVLTSGGGLLPVPWAGVVPTLNPVRKEDMEGSMTLRSSSAASAGTSAATVTMPTASVGTLTLGGVTVPYDSGGTLTLTESETYTGASSTHPGNTGFTTTKAPARHRARRSRSTVGATWNAQPVLRSGVPWLRTHSEGVVLPLRLDAAGHGG